MSRATVAVLMSDKVTLSWTDRRHLVSDALLKELRREFAVRFEPEADLSDRATTARLLQGAEACIIGWGSPRFTDELIDTAPALRFIGYAGGSVKAYVCPAIVRRDITVCAADVVNAEDVSQTALGLILCGIRGLFPRFLQKRGQGGYERYPTRGISGKTVGIVGAGLIGRRVMAHLRGMELRLLLADPTVSPSEAAGLGAELVPLQDLAERSDVVSVHAPSLPETRGMFGGGFFARMKDDALFINTALGDLVDQAALGARLRESSIFAYLDILDPAQEDCLTGLPNVAMSPAVAGCIWDTQYRMGRFVVEELRRFFAGTPVLNRFDFSRMGIRA